MASDEDIRQCAEALRARGLVEPVQFTDDVGDAETVAAIVLAALTEPTELRATEPIITIPVAGRYKLLVGPIVHARTEETLDVSSAFDGSTLTLPL